MRNKINYEIVKLLLLLTVPALVTVGQTAQSNKFSKEKSKMKKEVKLESVQVVERMFAAFNQHETDALAATYAENVFVDSPDYPQPKRTRAEVAAHYREMFRQFPDIRDDIKSITAAGNRVFVEFVSSGTVKNPAPEMPSSVKGKNFSLTIASILEVENGKIVRDVTYYDQLSVLKQMGLMPE